MKTTVSPLNKSEDRIKVFYLVLIIVLFVLMYYFTLTDLISLWLSNEDYGHGFFVIPITLYLIWRKREILSKLPLKPTKYGYGLLALWAVLYGVGLVGHISTILYLSMVVFPLASVATLISGSASLMILGPIVFMIFMFPVPSEIYTRVTNPLLLISTTASYHILHMIDIPVLQEGNLLTLSNYSMKVVQACSGIRSLLSIMALAFLMSSIMIKNRLIGSVFFLTSIPVAILGNILRITITALLAYYVSPRAAEGFAHTVAGITTFVFSFLLLYWFMEFILWVSREKEPSSLS